MKPVLVLLFSASLWGLSWLPLKGFAAQGLSGPLLAFATYLFAGLVGLPMLWRQRRQWQAQSGVLLLIALVGGWGNTAFVSAIVVGDVVRVMLLFYLAPVWSVLGGRIFLGEHVSSRRAVAVVLSLAGAFLVVGGMAVFAAPPNVADVLAVTAGLAFSGNNILARKAQSVPTASKTVALLLGCGVTSFLMLVLPSAATPSPFAALQAVSPWMLLLLASYSLGWLALVTVTWQWSVSRLEAGRSGVISIAELVVALVSATLLGTEILTPMEFVGAALIGGAALLEATDTPPGFLLAKEVT